MAGPEPYSTLEVSIDRTTGLEVPIHHGLEVPTVALPADQASTVSPSPGKGHWTWWQRRRRLLLVVIVMVLLVIAAVIVGSVMGIARRRQSSSTAASTTSPTVSVTVSVAAPTPTPTLSPASLLSESKLSAIAFLDQQGLLQHRVYFQDTNNTIRESSWSARDRVWYVSNRAIATASPGSPLAAAATWGRFPLQISLFYVNGTGAVNELYTTDGNSWRPGGINNHNIVPATTSALTAIWHRHETCLRCPNTLLLVYQDERNRFNLGNATGEGWRWSILNANPIPGSGASLAMTWKANITELQLFFQIASGNLCSLDWKENVEDANPGFNDQWANRESSPLPVISMNAPITSFTYGLVPNKKLPILLDVLSSTSRGVNNIWWRGRDGGEWLGPESPTVMSGVNNYTALAAHGWAHVYAMQGQEIKEFKVEDDGRTWTMRGSVPTS